MSDRPDPRAVGDGDVRDAGDAALVLELAAAIDPAVNARAIAIAAALRQSSLAGLRDVVSTFRSVVAYFDPLVADRDRVATALLAARATGGVAVAGRAHEVPVAYGGDGGPDLADVAAFARSTEADVVSRHAGVAYRVFMLGFLPGFPYLGLVDPAIAAPRRATPRLRIAAGSVGIAGQQTGVYPSDSPGGWQIIGRTSVRMFDPGRTPAALVAPGDTVTFVSDSGQARVASGSVTHLGMARVSPAPSRRTVTVVRAGLFTTIQDGGRWGEQGIGMPVSGAMDRVSHALANVAVGNDPAAEAIEVTLAGPELRFEQETVVAVAGADLDARIGEVRLSMATPTRCAAGSVLRFGARARGARTYIAFDGGVRAASRWPVVPLRAGDVVALGDHRHPGKRLVPPDPMPVGGARLRVLSGPQAHEVSDDVVDRLLSSRFTISPQSNRMGYRLKGPALPASSGGEMISDATFTGGVQVPPSGEPILLMADRQTTGGYPQVVTVISADVPKAAQLAPGDWVEFSVCSRAEAMAALAHQEEALHGGR